MPTQGLGSWAALPMGCPRLTVLHSLQLTGRFRESCWSYWIKWMDSIRTSMSRFGIQDGQGRCGVGIGRMEAGLWGDSCCRGRESVEGTEVWAGLSPMPGDHGHKQSRHPGSCPVAPGTPWPKNWISTPWPPAEETDFLYYHQQDESLWGGWLGRLYPPLEARGGHPWEWGLYLHLCLHHHPDWAGGRLRSGERADNKDSPWTTSGSGR